MEIFIKIFIKVFINIFIKIFIKIFIEISFLEVKEAKHESTIFEVFSKIVKAFMEILTEIFSHSTQSENGGSKR